MIGHLVNLTAATQARGRVIGPERRSIPRAVVQGAGKEAKLPHSSVAQSLCDSCGLSGGPVRVAKLPAPIAVLRDSGEVAGNVHAIAVGEIYDLMPRGGNHGEVLREGIDPETVPPMEFDLPDRAAEVRNSGLG